MKVLIDTCIIVDALQSRENFAANAKKIFLLAANERFNGCITAKSVTDIYYLTHRYTHDEKAARNILEKLFALFEVVDTAGIDCRRAVPSQISDYEDAVMCETALRTASDCIVTRNIRDYSKSPVAVYSPDEFIKLLEDQQDLT